jgi:hypothetical protein
MPNLATKLWKEAGVCILLIVITFFAVTAFAEQKIELGYDFHNRDKNDYHSTEFSYSLILGTNIASLSYSAYLSENKDDLTLQDASLMYLNFGKQHLFGFFAGSASDKPFNTINVLNAIALYGYNVYSEVLGTMEYELPDGRKVPIDRESNLYLGVAVASQPIFLDTYFFPLLSYSYTGENFVLRLGVPFNSITFIPHQKHTIEITLSLDNNYKINYEFTPTEDDTISVYYGRELEGYVLSEYDDRDLTLWYHKEWIRLSYEHIFFDFLGVEARLGYMTGGNYYLGESFKRKSGNTLPKEFLYGINLSAKF